MCVCVYMCVYVGCRVGVFWGVSGAVRGISGVVRGVSGRVRVVRGVLAGVSYRAGGTGPAAPALAGPIFRAPILHF